MSKWTNEWANECMNQKVKWTSVNASIIHPALSRFLFLYPPQIPSSHRKCRCLLRISGAAYSIISERAQFHRSDKTRDAQMKVAQRAFTCSPQLFCSSAIVASLCNIRRARDSPCLVEVLAHSIILALIIVFPVVETALLPESRLAVTGAQVLLYPLSLNK